MADHRTLGLDYAFLAEYAKVTEGLLTALGASYTFVGAATLPSPFTLCVAGRVRAEAGSRPNLGISLRTPEDRYRLELGLELTTEGARPYGKHNNRVGVL